MLFSEKDVKEQASMVVVTLEAIVDKLSEGEFATKLATCMHKMVVALVDAGFSRAEAISIIAAVANKKP